MIAELEEKYLERFEELNKQLGSVYASAPWLSIYGEKLKRYGIFNKGGQLIGGFFLFEQKRMGMKVLGNAPFAPHIALFFENRSSNRSKKYSAEKKIMGELATFLEPIRKKQLLMLKLPPGYMDMQPFLWQKFKVSPSYTYRFSLDQGEEAIKACLAPERRNDLRKAEKDGLLVKPCKDMALVEKLVLNTFSQKQKDIDGALLHRILFDFANEENSFAFVTYRDDKPLAVACCIYDKNNVYYQLGGYDRDHSHQGAGALAVWASIQKSLEMKKKVFDFEGSMLPEVEKYFRGFGAELTPFFGVHGAPFLVETALKKKKPELF